MESIFHSFSNSHESIFTDHVVLQSGIEDGRCRQGVAISGGGGKISKVNVYGVDCYRWGYVTFRYNNFFIRN